jgi:hypothetical protein
VVVAPAEDRDVVEPLHGRKGVAYCHVDGIDSIFTRAEAAAVAAAVAEAGVREVICLAWEFEMDLRMECDRLESELGITIKLIMIPREIMEKNRKEPPPFLEVATLTAEPVVTAAFIVGCWILGGRSQTARWCMLRCSYLEQRAQLDMTC